MGTETLLTLDPIAPRITHVVAAAVIDAGGHILIAQRLAGKHLAGGWEFPGGKLEPGEARVAGLARELREELGIAIRDPRPLMRVRHTYPEGEVLIDMWVVTRYTGNPEGLDGQVLRWLDQDELERTEMLPADRPIGRALRLPERLIEPSTTAYTLVESTFRRRNPAVDGNAGERTRLVGILCNDHEEALHAATRNDSDFLALRGVLANRELAALCDSVPVPVFARGIELEQAWALGASGCNEIGS